MVKEIKEGNYAVLDKEFANSSLIMVIELSNPTGLFAIVADSHGSRWYTSKYRLTPVGQHKRRVLMARDGWV
jgi:hypothetical protein